jgi:hypothetical protein
MFSYNLNKAIHTIYIDRQLALEFRDGDNGSLDRFDLTEPERSALAERDFVRLWSLDVHPVILFHLAAVLYPRDWYINNVAPRIRGVPNRWYDYYSREVEAARQAVV